jgi:abortive infection bacteriophage resistance protein
VNRGLEIYISSPLFAFKEKYMNKQPQEFLTIEQQIELLKERHLIFNNENFAKSMLLTHDYYEIINGYKQFYIIKTDNHNEIYKPGVTFEQIFSLFSFDRAIRQMLMSSLIDLEEHMRSLVSYVIAKHYGTKHKNYLNSKNYVNAKVSNQNWSKNNILASLNFVIEHPKPPITYHLNEYGNVPPWVLLKQVYMSTLFNLVRILKPKLKEEVIMLAYGVSREVAKQAEIKQLFMQSLILFLDYRNMAAHGNRMYSFKTKHDISLNEISIKKLRSYGLDLKEIAEYNGLGRLISLLYLFNYKMPYRNLDFVFTKEIYRHCSVYPKDIYHLIISSGYNPEKFEIKDKNFKYTIAEIVDENGNIINEQKFNSIFSNKPIVNEVAATLEQEDSVFMLKHNYRKCRRPQTRRNWKTRK